MIVDAQSVKTTDLTKNSGYDGGKKISGIKRHMAVDINGLPQAILVTRANVSNRSGALAMFSLASQTLELVQHVMVDGGYTGNDFADQVKLILNAKTTVAKRNELHTFTVLPQRWIVERSWSWLDKCRRLWKNCERALNSSLQMVVLAFLKIVQKDTRQVLRLSFAKVFNPCGLCSTAWLQAWFVLQFSHRYDVSIFVKDNGFTVLLWTRKWISCWRCECVVCFSCH